MYIPAPHGHAPTNEDYGERGDPWPVVIVGVLALILMMLVVIPRLMKLAAGGLEDQANEHLLLQSASHLKRLENRLVAFQAEFGRYPGRFQGLEVLARERQEGAAPPWAIVQRKIMSDAWGRPIIYLVPSEDGEHPFELRCLGRDGRPGGEGPDRDISNWHWPSRTEAGWPSEGAAQAP